MIIAATCLATSTETGEPDCDSLLCEQACALGAIDRACHEHKRSIQVSSLIIAELARTLVECDVSGHCYEIVVCKR